MEKKILSLETLSKGAVLKILCRHHNNKGLRSTKRILVDLEKAGHVLGQTSQELATLLDKQRQITVLERQKAHIVKKVDKLSQKLLNSESWTTEWSKILTDKISLLFQNIEVEKQLIKLELQLKHFLICKIS